MSSDTSVSGSQQKFDLDFRVSFPPHVTDEQLQELRSAALREITDRVMETKAQAPDIGSQEDNQCRFSSHYSVSC